MSEKFSSEDDKILIDLVRQHPELYAVKKRRYRDFIVKNDIWKEISQVMGKSEKECQGRWKSIRDYYQRKRKEVTKGTGSQARVPDTFSNKFKHLLFLENAETVEPKSAVNMDDNDDSDSAHTEIDEQNIEERNVEESQIIQNKKSVVRRAPIRKLRGRTWTRPRRARGINYRNLLFKEIQNSRIETSIIGELLKSRSYTENETALTLFFKSIAATVSKFPIELQVRAKREVMNVVYKLEVEHLSQQSAESISRPATPYLYNCSPNSHVTSDEDIPRPSSSMRIFHRDLAQCLHASTDMF